GESLQIKALRMHCSLIGLEEMRRPTEPVILRLLACQSQTVIERQSEAHLPIVLIVPLNIVVKVVAFEHLRLLSVGIKDAESRVGIAEAAIDRVVRVLAEVDRAPEVE